MTWHQACIWQACFKTDVMHPLLHALLCWHKYAKIGAAKDWEAKKKASKKYNSGKKKLTEAGFEPSALELGSLALAKCQPKLLDIL